MKKKLRALLLAALVLLLALQAPLIHANGAAPGKAKYVFLFIGDGLGLTQTQAAQLYLAAQESDAYPPMPAALSYTSFPYLGLQYTHSASAVVTDSAAAATAMASGVKVANGSINRDGETALSPLTQKIRPLGYQVGVISTCSLNHATPAAFYASAADRYGEYYQIGLQALRGTVDYLAGGAFSQDKGSKGGQKSLNSLAREKGFTLATGRAQLSALKADDLPVVVQQPGKLMAPHMDYVLDRDKDCAPLPELVETGARLLSARGPFFLMAEAGRIDTACAANDLGGAVQEVLELSAAVGAAVRFYNQHPTETLIVVLADHETGGLMLESNARLDRLSTQSGSAAALEKEIDALVQAKGGLDAAMAAAQKVLGLSMEGEAAITAGQRARLEAAWADALALDGLTAAEKAAYHNLHPFVYTACAVKAERAHARFATTAHTGQAVPVYALGQGAQAFAGLYDNTQVDRKLLSAMGL